MTLYDYLRETNMSVARFARNVGMSRSNMLRLVKGQRKIPAERVLDLERATNGKVTRHELRPDLYPRERVA
jgi:DNA-binding transcriptional regulator YdaS (Cro superfamily)